MQVYELIENIKKLPKNDLRILLQAVEKVIFFSDPFMG